MSEEKHHVHRLAIGSLFSGIGGLELGLERAGLGYVVFQVEANPERRRVLYKHWPGVWMHSDVREFSPHAAPRADLICGGFPCQDVSDASRGRGGGIEGEKSGLWAHFARIVGECRPRFVIVENVGGAALAKWLPTVRRDLHMLGYRTRAIRVDARDVGAPHARARVFVIADPYAQGKSARALDGEVAELSPAPVFGGHWRAPFGGVHRVADGVPERVDRVEALGDAVVPQAAELVGRLIVRDYLEAA